MNFTCSHSASSLNWRECPCKYVCEIYFEIYEFIYKMYRIVYREILLSLSG